MVIDMGNTKFDILHVFDYGMKLRIISCYPEAMISDPTPLHPAKKAFFMLPSSEIH